MIAVRINGVDAAIDADPRRPLLDVVREDLQLLGTKYGCGEGECGACTVLVDGKAVCSCLIPVGSVHNKSVVTVEGLRNDPVGTQLMAAFRAEGAVQCGFCTPGFIVAAWQALSRPGHTTVASIVDELGGNLCRCTGYTKIIKAVERAAAFTEGARATPKPTTRPGEALRTPLFFGPTNLEDLLDFLDGDPGPLTFVAGGTDLVVKAGARFREDQVLVDISSLRELSEIRLDNDRICIGAAVTWTQIRNSEIIREHLPLLAQAAATVGASQIQNSGTLAGNVVNASPAGDGLPPLVAYDARVETCSRSGLSEIAITDFILAPGRCQLSKDQIVSNIFVPLAGEGRWSFFNKVGPRKAQTIAKVSVAFTARYRAGTLRDVRVALGAVGPQVLRAPQAEQILEAGPLTIDRIEAAAAAAAASCTPIDDVRSTARHRRRLVRGILIHELKALWSLETGTSST